MKKKGSERSGLMCLLLLDVVVLSACMVAIDEEPVEPIDENITHVENITSLLTENISEQNTSVIFQENNSQQNMSNTSNEAIVPKEKMYEEIFDTITNETHFILVKHDNFTIDDYYGYYTGLQRKLIPYYGNITSPPLVMQIFNTYSEDAQNYSGVSISICDTTDSYMTHVFKITKYSPKKENWDSYDFFNNSITSYVSDRGYLLHELERLNRYERSGVMHDFTCNTQEECDEKLSNFPIITPTIACTIIKNQEFDETEDYNDS